MPINNSFQFQAPSMQQPLANIFNSPIVAKRAPTTADLNYPIGQVWVQPKTAAGVAVNGYWSLTSVVNNAATWTDLVGGGGVFTSLTVNGATTLNGSVTATGVTALGVTGIVGGFTQTGGTFSVGADAAASTVNINTGAGVKTTNIGSTNTTSTTIVSAGSGGLSFSSGGNLSTAAVTATAASPTATTAINARVGKATFTGFTTANAGGTQAFTVTNTGILTTSGVLLTVTHLNASGNGAFLQIQNITQIAGSLVVTVANNGAGALGAGDDVIISFWQFS